MFPPIDSSMFDLASWHFWEYLERSVSVAGPKEKRWVHRNLLSNRQPNCEESLMRYQRSRGAACRTAPRNSSTNDGTTTRVSGRTRPMAGGGRSQFIRMIWKRFWISG